MGHKRALLYHGVANKPTVHLMLSGHRRLSAIPEALQMRYHPRDKTEMSFVPAITPAPNTLQTGTQQRCFALQKSVWS